MRSTDDGPFPADSPSVGSAGRPRDLVLVFAAAVLLAAWTLRLPFQLDDYGLLAHPLRLFDREWAHRNEDVVPFMLRWPMWIAWAVAQPFAGEPRSPVAYHVVGLVLHGLVAVLVARCVNRRTPWARGRAGLLAGLAFAAASGHLQAVSWTAAWSGMLYTLFGWLALDSFEAARVRGGRWRLALAALAVWLALVSKTPGIVVVGALAWVLLASARSPGRVGWLRRPLRVELPLVALGLAAGLVSRLAFLGSLSLRYYRTTAVEESSLARLPRALTGLGQALYPWNADPLFNGEAPLIARLCWPPLPAWAIGIGVVGGLLVLAAAGVPRVRRTLAVLGVALIPCAAPVAMLYGGQATNVAGRAAYLPMTVIAAAIGVALAGLARRSPRGVLIGSVALALFFLDGGVHYARTELLAAAEQARWRALVGRVRADHGARGSGRPLVLLAIRPEAGFAGIPALGPLLDRAFREPFAARTTTMELFGDRADLGRRFGALGLSGCDVALVGPALGADGRPLAADPGASGPENRARRSPRLLSELREGSESRGAALVERGGRWVPAAPLAAHVPSAVELEFDAAARGELFVLAGGLRRSLGSVTHGAPGAVRRVLAVDLDADFLLGPPIDAFEWEGEGAPTALRWRAELPRVELLDAADGQVLLLRDGSLPPPRWRARLPRGAARPATARIELALSVGDGSQAVFYGDVVVPAEGDELLLTPATLHDGRRPPPVEGVPWETVTGESLVPLLTEHRLRRVSFTWRIAFHDHDGNVTARSPYARGYLAAFSQ